MNYHGSMKMSVADISRKKKETSQLYRQWLILKDMPRRNKITTNIILDRLVNSYGISTTLRTVQRDLKALVDDCRFPLYCDGEKEAGWRWSDNAAAFDVVNMDPVTALTFKLAEKHITRMLPLGVISALKPYIKAADDRLKLTPESSFSRWPGKVRVVSRNLAMIPPVVAEDISEDVYSAFLDEKRFKVEYRTIKGRKKTHEVNPLGIAFVDGLTYLVVSLNSHEDPVLLLLHRILSVVVLDKAATVPEGFDLDAYLAKELAYPVGGDICLKVLFGNQADIHRLEESPIATDQAVSVREDGKFELTVTVADSLQLHWWLRGFGTRVEVVEPEYLRKEFAEMVSELAERYKS
jgi:predicted DNA-binding transcriptional regulator YafY